MGLGVKSVYEENRLNFLSDKVYCRVMISEVIELLPKRNFSEPIYNLAKAYGKEVDMQEIRDTIRGSMNDRFIAYCVNQYGKTLIGKK